MNARNRCINILHVVALSISIIRNSNYRKILSNLSYLSVIQISNLVIPVITYPYLIETLGASVYGKVVYAQAVGTYLAIFVNFGLNIIGTKEISIHRNNRIKLNRVISGIFQLKLLLFLITVLLLFVYLFAVGSSVSEYFLYGFSLWSCLYEFLFPVWYFQGLEKMKNIAIISVLNKLFVLLAILLFVKTESDYLYVPLIYFVGVLLMGLIGFIQLHGDEFRFKLQGRHSMYFYFNRSYVMALSYGTNAIKTNMNLIVVKYLFSYTAVAYFDLALKIAGIVNSFLDLVSQAIYPKMSIHKDMNFLKKILKLTLLASIILTLSMQFLSGIAVHILGGASMEESIPILRLLSFIFPVYIAGALLGRNALVIHGYNTAVLQSMLVSAIAYCGIIISAYYLLNIRSLHLISIAYVVSFLIETIYRYLMCRKYKII